MDYGIRNQTAHFLKSSRLSAGAPVQSGQCGDQKATAVRSTVHNKSIRKVIVLIVAYIHITVLLVILIINLFAAQPHCPGDLRYVEMGPAFPPTCSNPQNHTTELTSTCLPAEGWSLVSSKRGN